MSVERIPVEKICTVGGTQPRAILDAQVVEEYFEAQARGDAFPPIDVVYDGEFYWPYDGFHRIEVCRRASAPLIPARVIQGTVEDARWLSCAANATHGLRRSNGDKRRAVETALRHDRGAGMSDRAIAEHVGVHHSTVAQIRGELEATGGIRQLETRLGKDGKERRLPEKSSKEEEKQEVVYPEPNEQGNYLPWTSYDWKEYKPEDPRLSGCWVRELVAGEDPEGDTLVGDPLYAVGWGARLGKRATVIQASTDTLTTMGAQYGASCMVDWVEEVYPTLSEADQAMARALLRWLEYALGCTSQEVAFNVEEPEQDPEEPEAKPKLQVVPVSKGAVRTSREAIEWFSAEGGPWIDHGLELRGQVEYVQVLRAMKALTLIRDAVRQIHAG